MAETLRKTVAVATDTNSGITEAQAHQLGVYLVPMPVIIDGQTYFENETISQETFFQRLNGGAEVSTSQPPVGLLLDRWDALLKTFDQVIYIPMSSALSGSCQTAKMLAAEYQGRVLVVDNHRISIPQRQSVLDALYLLSQGKTAEEVTAYLDVDGMAASAYVAVNTLEFLKKSGRVTAAGAAVATMLNIKPILQIQGGKLDAFKKSRGMHAATEVMIAALRKDRETRFAGRPVAIRAGFAGDPVAGEAWRAALQAAFPDISVGMDPLPISISSHTGDGALGACITWDILPAGWPR